MDDMDPPLPHLFQQTTTELIFPISTCVLILNELQLELHKELSYQILNDSYTQPRILVKGNNMPHNKNLVG